MGFFTGFAFGTMMRVYANVTVEVRPFRRPWEILGSGLLFGYIGHNIDDFNTFMLKRINQGREELGLPPILSKLEYEPKNTSFWK